MENGISTENNIRLTSPAMARLCLVPARQTGIASLCIQIIGLIISAALAILLLLHLDGTIISRTTKNHTVSSTTPQTAPTTAFINAATVNSTELSQDTNLIVSSFWDENTFSDANENGTIMFGESGPQLDLLQLLQISTVVYIGMCMLWLLSLMSLLVSIKLESLDLIIMNSVLLTVVIIYVIIHALFVSILFVYYKHVSWTTLVITSAVVLGLALTSAICGFALAFNIVWYRYVVYINDSDQCQCLSTIVKLFKRHRKRQPTQEYSIPEATRHSNLPSANEPVVQNFSRL